MTNTLPPSHIPGDPERFVPSANPTQNAHRKWELYARSVIGRRAMQDLQDHGLFVVPLDWLIDGLRTRDPDFAEQVRVGCTERDHARLHSARPEGSQPIMTRESSHSDQPVARSATSEAAASGE